MSDVAASMLLSADLRPCSVCIYPPASYPPAIPAQSFVIYPPHRAQRTVLPPSCSRVLLRGSFSDLLQLFPFIAPSPYESYRIILQKSCRILYFIHGLSNVYMPKARNKSPDKMRSARAGSARPRSLPATTPRLSAAIMAMTAPMNTGIKLP